MWRTFAILSLIAFLLVSVGGNVLLFQQAAGNRSEAENYRDRLRTALQVDRPTLEARVNQLNAENERLRQQPNAASGTPVPGAPVPSPSGASSTAATTSGPDRTILGRIEDQVSQIRGLRRQSEVPLKFLDQTALRQYFVQSFEQEYLPLERETDQKLLVTLGLLRPSENLVQILLDLLQEQVIGLYNEDDKAMFVIGGGQEFGPLEQSTFAHEFVHALQDQYYDLGKLAPKHPDNTDQSMAVHALLEGDAVLTQRLWERDNLTPDQIGQMFSGGDSSKLETAPLVVRTELLFPYTDGFAFVRAAYQSGGSQFSGVDAVYSRPPASTEQILHPEKYRANEAPIPVDIPDLAQVMGEGWRRIQSNTLGELDTRIVVEQFTDRRTADRAAAGWGGDRWQLLEQGDKQAIVLRTVWDSENDAREFFDAFGLALKGRFGGAVRVDEQSLTRQALTASTNASDLRVKGRETLAVISFDRASADALAQAVGGF